MYDHLEESITAIQTKYSGFHFLLLADNNRLDLGPISSLSNNFKKGVNLPTRSISQATFDTIITVLWAFYQPPVKKPPIDA